MRDQIYTFYGVSAVHDSGTKYYQIIRINKKGSNQGILVTHWGKQRPGVPDEPKNHGQNKIEQISSSLDAAFSEKSRMKQKRGYATFDISLNKDLGIIKTGIELARLFNPSDVTSIVGFLDSLDTEVEVVEIEDSAPVVKSTIAAPLHEQWGTW